VFGYQGRSWLFATVHLPHSAAKRFDVQLITRDGRQQPAGAAVLGGTHNTWAAQIPMNLTQVTSYGSLGRPADHDRGQPQRHRPLGPG
jgi:hypothetical protein